MSCKGAGRLTDWRLVRRRKSASPITKLCRAFLHNLFNSQTDVPPTAFLQDENGHPASPRSIPDSTEIKSDLLLLLVLAANDDQVSRWWWWSLKAHDELVIHLLGWWIYGGRVVRRRFGHLRWWIILFLFYVQWERRWRCSMNKHDTINTTRPSDGSYA